MNTPSTFSLPTIERSRPPEAPLPGGETGPAGASAPARWGGRLARAIAGCFLLAIGVAGCGERSGPGHPWLDLEGSPAHELLEVGGVTSGQLIVLVPENAAWAEVMELAHRIAAQVPPGTTVNARIFNDRETARNWRTAPAEWTVQHLLAVVTSVPGGGAPEVRWVGPEERVPPEEREPGEPAAAETDP